MSNKKIVEDENKSYNISILFFVAAGVAALYELLEFISASGNHEEYSYFFAITMLACASSYMMKFFEDKKNDKGINTKKFTILICVYIVIAIILGIVSVSCLMHSYDFLIALNVFGFALIVILTFVVIKGYVSFFKTGKK